MELVVMPTAAVGSPAPFASYGVTFVDAQLEDAIHARLAEVEQHLRTAVRSVDPLLAETASHLVEAGGKRFRPLLALLCAQLAPAEGAVYPTDAIDPTDVAGNVVRAAVVVELTHLATLYHDDVMDEALVRRGAPSVNARWDNSVAILTGDYLFARAADIASELGNSAVRIQARTFARLVTGQIAETVGPRGVDPIEHHLRVIADKTGSLIGTSARLGAMFGGCQDHVTAALAEYGEIIGGAFQLSDDLLDIASESELSGKTPGTDLREGVRTLPVLYALADDATDPRLREILEAGALTDDDTVAEALALLRNSAALERARQTVRGYARRARETLVGVPDGPARQALSDLADFIADRSA